MRRLATTVPIAFRQQNGGDYLIPTMQLRPGLGDPAATSFALHVDRAKDVEELHVQRYPEAQLSA
jgi:NAD(P)H dehydrogenase (quinone)